MAYFCIVLVRAPTPLYARKNFKSLASAIPEISGPKIQKWAPSPLCGGSGPTSNTMCLPPNNILMCSAIFVQWSRVTVRLTDTANISKNSLHLMHSMQPKKWWTKTWPEISGLVSEVKRAKDWIWWHSDRACKHLAQNRRSERLLKPASTAGTSDAIQQANVTWHKLHWMTLHDRHYFHFISVYSILQIFQHLCNGWS